MRRTAIRLTTLGVLALTLVPAALAAEAGVGASDDARRLPIVRGIVQLFTLTPRSDIDGFVLTDGTEVKTPPHLSTQIALILRPGDAVTVRGLRAAKLPLIQALSVTNDRDGTSVVDTGSDLSATRGQGDRADDRPITGRVRMPLHGPRGEVNGILLDDGTILKVPPPDIDRFIPLLKPGRTLAAEGTSRVTVAGRVVEVTALGASEAQLQPVE